MKVQTPRGGWSGLGGRITSLVCVIGGGMGWQVNAQTEGQPELRESLAGEAGALELKRALTNEVYNLHYGHVGIQTEARLGAGYTDNVLLSAVNRREDFIINPEVNLSALVPVSELNALRLSLGLSYEWFAKNHDLNSDAPLVSPGSELAFNIFVGDVRIKLHDKFSYQQTMVFNDQTSDQTRVNNFTDVGRFDRLDNLAGLLIDWDLNKVILSASYDHENFISTSDAFKYLTRASEWFRFTFNYLLGPQTKVGLETQASLHNYDQETILNDNWRERVGPFAEMRLPKGLVVKAGAGYDGAQYDNTASGGSDYNTGYGYATIGQELRYFTHSLDVGHETEIGDNANNLRVTYVRYSIASDVIKNLELEGSFSVNFCKEFGGDFEEDFVQYVPGLRAGYQFHKYWRANLGYELFLKDSDTPQRSFHRNLVSLDVTFKF